MKIEEFVDDDNKKKISIVRNADEDLKQEGIVIAPPPLDDILDKAKVDLHNELVTRGLLTASDVFERMDELEAAVRKTVTSKIVSLFREKEQNTKE